MFCEHNAKQRKEGCCAKCLELKPFKQFKTCKKQCFNCKECGWFYGPGAEESKIGKPVPEQEQTHANPEAPPEWQPSESDLRKMKKAPHLDLDSQLGNEKCGVDWLKTQLPRYTADSIRQALAPKYDTYYAKLAIGQAPNWKCDQQVKDNFVLSNWLMDELLALQAEQTDRIDSQHFFNRKARAEEDLYEVAARAMNNYLDHKNR